MDPRVLQAVLVSAAEANLALEEQEQQVIPERIYILSLGNTTAQKTFKFLFDFDLHASCKLLDLFFNDII